MVVVVGWPGNVEGDVEHPEEGGKVEVVHDDGQGKAGLTWHLSWQHVGQEAAVRSCNIPIKIKIKRFFGGEKQFFIRNAKNWKTNIFLNHFLTKQK